MFFMDRFVVAWPTLFGGHLRISCKCSPRLALSLRRKDIEMGLQRKKGVNVVSNHEQSRTRLSVWMLVAHEEGVVGCLKSTND